MASFKSAWQAGVDGIELDVRLSRDGHVVVCHDAHLARFGGTRRPLASMTYAEISTHDVGSWFDQQFAQERVPLLADVLNAFPFRVVCIEIKAVGGSNARVINHRLVRATCAVIAQGRASERVCLLCFNGAVLAEVARIAPHLKCVRNCERLPKKLSGWLDRQSYLYGLDVDRRILTRAVVDACRTRKIVLFSYTANTASQWRQMRTFSVHAILSDRAAWLVTMVKKKCG